MSKRETNITRSESWMRADIDEINETLQQAIDDHIDPDETIINVQVVEESGRWRFWIYSIKIK